MDTFLGGLSDLRDMYDDRWSAVAVYVKVPSDDEDQAEYRFYIAKTLNTDVTMHSFLQFLEYMTADVCSAVVMANSEIDGMDTQQCEGSAWWVLNDYVVNVNE